MATTFTGVLPSGSALNLDDNVISNSGRYLLAMQRDGNLVLYDRSGGGLRALWASNTAGQAVNDCAMQTDGNLVIYGFPNPIWASNTAGHPNSFLQVQDDGNVVIIQPGAPIWATGTVQP